MRFLIDQNIPLSAARLLENNGHSTTHVRDVLRQDSPDQLIAYLAIQEDFVILTHDADFRNINALAPRGFKQRLRRSNRIILGPTSTKAAPRLLAELDLLVAMYDWAESNNNQYRVDITEVSVQIVDQVAPVRSTNI